jgi:predicted 3-demethylubiquinone-9 3-methyltransferase (glyoxalase superfamily)
LDAAKFCNETFSGSTVVTVHHTPRDYPDGKQGDVLTVEFTLMGIPCLGLNGSPAFKHNEAFSFQVATDDQVETDRLTMVQDLARTIRFFRNRKHIFVKTFEYFVPI